MVKILFENEKFSIVAYGVVRSHYGMFIGNTFSPINTPYWGEHSTIVWRNDDGTTSIIDMDGDIEVSPLPYYEFTKGAL